MERILLITYGSNKPCDRAFNNITFGLSKYYELKIYGRFEYGRHDTNICPINFDKSLTLNYLADKLKPDLIILPESSQIKASLPSENKFDTIDIPKLLIEVDYYTAINKNIYKEHNIDLIVTRAPVINETVNSVYLPLSVFEEFIASDEELQNRINRIIFVGAGRWSRNQFYKTRQKAINILENNNPWFDFIQEVPYNDYSYILKKYRMFLSCNLGELHKAPAKVWESMGAGCALLVPMFDAKEILFGKDKCFFEYKEDCSDLLDVVDYVYSNTEEATYIGRKARDIINEKHLHNHRIIELKNIIDALLSGKQIPKVWGF